MSLISHSIFHPNDLNLGGEQAEASALYMKRYQYYKTAAITPKVEIGNPKANVRHILDVIHQLDPSTQLAVAPELAITGYTCQDLFYESLLKKEALSALETLALKIPENLALVVGIPVEYKNHLYNCAAFIFNHEVLGFYAKNYLPNYNEYYEPRWFASARLLPEDASIRFMSKDVPLSKAIVFEDITTGAVIGPEICEDLWVSIPVSSMLAQAGANILTNCSASNDSIGKRSYRRDLILNQSARSYAAYIYASAGSDESSSDLVFGGNDLIAENGKLLAYSSLEDPKEYIQAEIDLEILQNDRSKYKSSFSAEEPKVKKVVYESVPYEEIQLIREIEAYPFVPKNLNKRIERCQEILTLQARGLATRLEKIHCQNVVIGISGGLDSTLALLVCVKAFKLAHLDPKGIHAITMPGFGTSDRTHSNSWQLMELLGTDAKEIPIGKAVNLHFEDIGHNPEIRDITYENSQARERTQILMDLANQVNGLVIGTGDLSELALGWCTYNGDHMSMYAVNVSVPKTLVRYIVESEAILARKFGNEKLADVLDDICATPVSPELLPPDQSGKIAQKTEEVLGSYDLHDFFLYHMLRFHESPSKIFELACLAFHEVPESQILKALKTFYNRFFAQQFKRNVMPDGVKVGSINFSPRGDWRMPSDAARTMWLNDLADIEQELNSEDYQN